jgi:hypothetical protein
MRKFPKTIVSVIIILLTALFFSCSKNPKCWGNDKNEGIINTSIDIKCAPKADQPEFVILDNSSFIQSFDSTCPLPNIDFSTESLLGLYADGECEVKFIREVTRVESEKKYHYKVNVKDCGYCKKLGYSYNWITVPKLPSGWTVTFEKK